MPNALSTDNQLRAIPLTCIAGLGQGLAAYMKRSPLLTLSESSKNFVLRDGVIENARFTVVRMSTNPSSAFLDVQAEPLSDEDVAWAHVGRKMFDIGTVVKRGFRAPIMGDGERAWRGNIYLEGTALSVCTNRKSRRHRY